MINGIINCRECSRQTDGEAAYAHRFKEMWLGRSDPRLLCSRCIQYRAIDHDDPVYSREQMKQ